MSNLEGIPPLSTQHTVLVVDDEAAIVQLCAATLEPAGFSVLSATSSAEVLRICKNHPGPIHVLLTDLVIPPPMFSVASADIEFPNVHGHELAVRALRMRRDLRVILMSGNIDQELAGYGMRRGSLPFLPKPFDTQVLIALVRLTLHAALPSLESVFAKPLELSKYGDEWGH